MRGKPQNKHEATSTGTSIILDGLSLMQRGNEYFFSDCYLEATGYYYQAAMLLKRSPEHKKERSKAWSNVAECHLRLQNWQAAEDAATNAIGADKNNMKALYRRAKARFELTDYAGAAKDAEAVGTMDAMDVAALCKELAHAEVARRLTSGGTHPAGGRERRERRGERRQPASAEVRDQPPPNSNNEMDERELWFRRIIDSYRLRVDDEYTKTGASDAGCLYGIQAKGLEKVKSPMDHFQAYVNRAIKKRVLPEWFTITDMEELCVLAIKDSFSNINHPVAPEDIVRYYSERMGPQHNELKQLRDLAGYIEGPIGMPWNQDHKPATAPELKKPTKNHNGVILESGAVSRNPSFGGNPGVRSSQNNFKQVYDLSEQYRQPPAGYGQGPEVSTGAYHVRQPTIKEQSVSSYYETSHPKREKHGQRLPYRAKQPAPVPSKQVRSASHIAVNNHEMRNPEYGNHFDHRKSGQNWQQQQCHSFNACAGHSPRTKKRVEPAWSNTMKPNHTQGNRYGLIFSDKPPSPKALTDSESTLSEEFLSFGPQLPYNLSAKHGLSFRSQIPINPSGIPNQHSARKMMMSLMPSMESDDEAEIYERKIARQETNTAREMRNGLWRGDHRDEFSELTELSP